MLIRRGTITEAQLERALLEQQKSGMKLGRVLVSLGYLSNRDLMTFLAEQLGVPFVDLTSRPPGPESAELLSGKLARRYQVIPLATKEDVLALGMVNPLDRSVQQEIADLTGLAVKPVLVGEEAFETAIDEIYGGEGRIERAAGKVAELRGKEDLSQDELLLSDLEGGAVVDLVDQLLQKAVRLRASDIHVEPASKDVMIRFRIDGVLFEQARYDTTMLAPIVSRVKVLARMDISEKRIPQDGSFVYQDDRGEIDLRVSTYPTIHGENLVLRLLARSEGIRSIEDLGYSSDHLATFQRMLKQPHGMILVTGPTGSGKTTTLYAALRQIGSREKNILTIEDPVEYSIDLARQGQVNKKAGLTFASGLRAILRQDPDIILVGEIRDLETATTAIQAALTGHLVFSTLHTNSALGAVTRLVDMGVQPYLVASSTVCVLAQRLARILCDHCKTPGTISIDIARELSLLDDIESHVIQNARGCPKCNQTGYLGRTAIAEIVPIDPEIKALVNAHATEEELRRAAAQAGVKFLRQDGIEKVLRGVTTVAELFRVVRE